MIIFDTSAWIEYFLDSEKADFIEDIMNNDETCTPSIVLIELSCKAAKEKWDFSECLRFIKSKSSITGINDDILLECGKIYIEKRKIKPSFSMIDAAIISIAKEKSAKILTKDNHFKDFRDVIMI